jgi:hypothetical protein
MPTRRSVGRPRHARIAPAEPTPPPAEQVAEEAPEEQPAAPAPPRRNPLYPVGTTLFPLDTEAGNWSDWYTHDMAGDLGVLEEARFAIVRLLVSWKALEPQVGQYDEAVFALRGLTPSVRRTAGHRLFSGDDRHAELTDVCGVRRDPPPIRISFSVSLLRRWFSLTMTQGVRWRRR